MACILPAVFKGTLYTLGILIMFLHTRQTEYMSTSHLTRIYHLKILRKTESTLLCLTHLYYSGFLYCKIVKRAVSETVGYEFLFQFIHQ